MTVNVVKEETELSGSDNVASKKKSPFNDWKMHLTHTL